MRLYWRALLLAAVFIITLIIMRHYRSDENELHLWDIDPTQLNSIDIKRDELSLRFEYYDHVWHFKEGEASVPVDETKWAWRLTPILHPQADSRLGVDGSDSAARHRYGLQPLLNRLVLTLGNGQRYQLRIGRQTPLQRHYYVQVGDDSTLFLLPVSTLAPLLQVEKRDVIRSDSTESPANIPVEDFLAPDQSPPQ